MIRRRRLAAAVLALALLGATFAPPVYADPPAFVCELLPFLCPPPPDKPPKPTPRATPRATPRVVATPTPTPIPGASQTQLPNTATQ